MPNGIDDNKRSRVESDRILCQNRPELGRVRCELAESEASPPSSEIEELFRVSERYRTQRHLM